MQGLEGEVGFVSGGATGIGLPGGRAVVEAGGRVMLAARREDVLREAAEGLGWARPPPGCAAT